MFFDFRTSAVALLRALLAIGETEECRRYPIYLCQLVIEDSHSGKTNHMVRAVIASTLCAIPYRNGNVNCLQHIQRMPHRVTVRKSRFSLDQIAYGNDMIAWISRIDICAAVSRRRQTGYERRLTGTPCPGNPAEIALPTSIIDVAQYRSDCHARNCLIIQRDRI